ncbi:PREDICTED: centrosomal protein of 70 kDa-like [Amphimedon queenslandica]|uniref:Centrosomal protein of 70 kDa n=1 Tax=Amphimedon queenslandica TaxID=400682 RepID=A0A1X7UXM3_AMPQE|nr:PREDICTED: centrosomal protein of 70 kDa-like [Amphimedon queenslandica]|eukprot:XP_019851588.1 PREDICTED: centrosomal protein of 70 kDa-like [Amphimedon queenslandica]
MSCRKINMSTDSCNLLMSHLSPSLSAPLSAKAKRKSRTPRKDEEHSDSVQKWGEKWNAVNKLLIKQGYPPLATDEEGLISTDETGSSVIYHTLNLLLEDLNRKDMIINHFMSSSEETPPSTDDALNKTTPSSENESLKKLVTELQYHNAKLKIDVMNRPHAAELKACQQRVSDLEAEIKQYRSCTKFDEVDVRNAIEHLKDIGAVLKVDKLIDIIPTLLSLQREVEKYKDIDPYLHAISSAVDSSSHSNLFCPSLWANASKEIKHWRDEIDELKELQVVFNDLLEAIESDRNGLRSTETHKALRKRKGSKRTPLSCKQLKDILQSWLLHIENEKAAQMGIVLSMIRHFQQLFDVPSLGGVYVAMTNIYRQFSEAHTAYRQLTSLMNRPGCPWQQLVYLIEKTIECKEKNFYVQLCDEYGDLSSEQVMDALALSSKFVPVFHKMTCDLQGILRVESLSAILPAVRRLTYSNH